MKTEDLTEMAARCERLGYRYLFRVDGGEIVEVRHHTRAGDVEECARKLGRLIGKREKASEVICIWKGPDTAPIPAEIRKEMRGA